MSFNLVSLFIWQGLPREPLQHLLCILSERRRLGCFFSFLCVLHKKTFLCCIFQTSHSICLTLFRRRQTPAIKPGELYRSTFAIVSRSFCSQWQVRRPGGLWVGGGPRLSLWARLAACVLMYVWLPVVPENKAEYTSWKPKFDLYFTPDGEVFTRTNICDDGWQVERQIDKIKIIMLRLSCGCRLIHSFHFISRRVLTVSLNTICELALTHWGKSFTMFSQ